MVVAHLLKKIITVAKLGRYQFGPRQTVDYIPTFILIADSTQWRYWFKRIKFF